MKPPKTTKKSVEILIAEDSPTQAEQLRHLLEQVGYQVTVAATGKQALTVVHTRRPALIVSDVVMPEMDGYALCKAIKTDGKLKEIPIVLLTSLSSAQDVMKGLECGADNFIRKPYDEKYLLARIDHILINQELRKDQKVHMGVEIYLGGQKYFITAERQQMLDLLFSIYEEVGHINKRLEETNKELESFSYSVSHDLRAPLRAIDGFSSSLLQDYAEQLDDTGLDYLQRIRSATQRMGQLIEDLLNLSRVTRAEMRHETLSLSTLADRVVSDIRKAHADRKVDVTIEKEMKVMGDARLLQIVLENLLGNAWKFTSKSPKAAIQVGSTHQNGETVYFVKDNGAGFDMVYAQKLFGAFQRLHTEKEYPGTGIGLATVRRIIHRHGGRIWAEGEVGKGATFYFTL
jgi:signal transduction histidine kinase